MHMKLQRLARDPLLHFLVIGCVLFAVAWIREESGVPEQTTIVISDDRIASLVSAWKIQNGSAPSPEELRNILVEDVDEEIFYREALSMGLDQDDRIVRRRLAQKLRFLVEGTLTDVSPSEQELMSWYTAHAGDYAIPERVTFRQVYFSAAGGQSEDAMAHAALADWSQTPQIAPEGDPSILPGRYRSVSQARIDTDFGAGFWPRLSDAPHGQWSGPVQSAFGSHLIYVEAREPKTRPAFEDIRDQIERDYMMAEKKRILDDRLREIRSRYDIVVHGEELSAK